MIPATLAATIPALYAQEHSPDHVAYVRFTLGTWAWYVFELDPATGECFGFVVGDYPEMGYFTLEELEENGAVRDERFAQTTISKIREEIAAAEQVSERAPASGFVVFVV